MTYSELKKAMQKSKQKTQEKVQSTAETNISVKLVDSHRNFIDISEGVGITSREQLEDRNHHTVRDSHKNAQSSRLLVPISAQRSNSHRTLKLPQTSTPLKLTQELSFQPGSHYLGAGGVADGSAALPPHPSSPKVNITKRQVYNRNNEVADLRAIKRKFFDNYEAAFYREDKRQASEVEHLRALHSALDWNSVRLKMQERRKGQLQTFHLSDNNEAARTMRLNDPNTVTNLQIKSHKMYYDLRNSKVNAVKESINGEFYRTFAAVRIERKEFQELGKQPDFLPGGYQRVLLDSRVDPFKDLTLEAKLMIPSVRKKIQNRNRGRIRRALFKFYIYNITLEELHNKTLCSTKRYLRPASQEYFHLVKFGYITLLQEMLKKKSNKYLIFEKDNVVLSLMQVGQTIYHYFAKRNCHEMLYDTLPFKGNLDERDVSNRTALEWAMKVNSESCVKVVREIILATTGCRS